MRKEKILAGALLAILSGLVFLRRPSAASPVDEPKLADFAWMAGHWASETAGTRTEEVWLSPDGGFLLGMNRAVPASGRATFEFLRIEQRDDGIVYVASPGGRAPTAFPLANFGDRFVLFEDPAHDFPQKIHYELVADDTLHARVSGDVNGTEVSEEWTWKRVR